MSNIRGVKDRRFKFVQLLNSMFEDSNLSLKAKGFIGYCLTKPQNWIFKVEHLCNVLKEGEDAIYAAIKECIQNGYAFRYQKRSNGKIDCWETVVSDSKEEIELLKKEFENDDELKNFLLVRDFPDLDSPDLESSPLSNIIKKEQYEKAAAAKESPLEKAIPTAAAAEKPKSKTSIEFTNVRGKKEVVSESDIFQHFLKLPYPTDLVKQAINRLKETLDPIGNVYKFLESIVLRLQNTSLEPKIFSKREKNHEESIPFCTDPPASPERVKELLGLK